MYCNNLCGLPQIVTVFSAGEAVDISVPAEVALAEEADEDTDVRFTEDGIPIEPFNLRTERAEGYFDEEGNYVAYRGGDDTDAWLETLPGLRL